jgi:hypothetical protein
MKRTAILLLALVAALGAASSASPGRAAGGFRARVDNPWFPLLPGSHWVYRGTKDGKPARDFVTVTKQTRTIDGAPCAAVSDRLYLSGRLEERTTDWYSQDAKGNVWYFGEATAELDRAGHVKNTSGSWLAGVKGAKPGIFMFARPKAGRSARQEYLKGQAEDHFKVLSLHVRVKVPYGEWRTALLTKEWTPLEPGTIDHKLYVRGIGTVLEQTVRGGSERSELVSFRRGR